MCDFDLMDKIKFDQNKLLLKTYSELYLVSLDKTLFFQADDHYSYACYTDRDRVMLPFGLSVIEERLNDPKYNNQFIRLGRKYIVNVARISKINVFKQQLFFEGKENSIVLNIPKQLLAQLMEMIESE